MFSFYCKDSNRVADEFAQDLKKIYGEELVSVILYGSAVKGEFNKRFSNVNVAVILKDARINSLKRAYPAVNSRKYSLISPVFFTETYIHESLDVFPIEFLDIQENGKVVYGKDIFRELRVDTKNLRCQCEHEIKALLLNIKRDYFVCSSGKKLEKMMFKSFNSLVHILKNVIRIKKGNASGTKEGILNSVNSIFGIDAGCLKCIYDLQKSPKRLPHKNIDSIFSDYVSCVEHISKIVDKI